MHILRSHKDRTAQATVKPIAGIAVRATRGKKPFLTVRTVDDVDNPIVILKIGTELAQLPDSIPVIDPETDKPIKAEHRFWITTETIDPYHVVVDREWP